MNTAHSCLHTRFKGVGGAQGLYVAYITSVSTLCRKAVGSVSMNMESPRRRIDCWRLHIFRSPLSLSPSLSFSFSVCLSSSLKNQKFALSLEFSFDSILLPMNRPIHVYLDENKISQRYKLYICTDITKK